MNALWPKVKLGEVLRSIPRPVHVETDVIYREIGIRSHSKGVFHKNPVSGSELGDKKVFWVEPGDFVLNIVFAWEGAVAVLTEADAGMIGSHRFPTFRTDETRLDSHFLLAYFRTPEGRDLLGRVSPGGAGRNRTLSRTAFLQQHIPLPALSIQRSVVNRVQNIAAHVAQAQLLRKQAYEETQALLAATELNIWPSESLMGAPTLLDVTSFLARGRQSEQGESEHYLIKTQHVQQGSYIPTMLRLAPHIAAKVSEEALAREGDVLIACSAAGCLGRVARYAENGGRVSTDTHVAIARPNRDLIDPDYFYAYLLGAQGQHQLRSRERGDWKREKISFRLTELNLSDLRKVPVPLPPFSEQTRIVNELRQFRAEVQALNKLQSESSAEIDALLPSLLSNTFSGRL
jgi:type I restriction enzyme, S subunit